MIKAAEAGWMDGLRPPLKGSTIATQTDPVEPFEPVQAFEPAQEPLQAFGALGPGLAPGPSGGASAGLGSMSAL